MNRIDRLTGILIHLQSKRLVKAEEIADRYEISLRTVYRDVRALTEAGVPIGSEPGKGYFIVDGYSLPPVMFTREEASSLLLAGKLVEKMTDKSIQNSFDSALFKIKAVLSDDEKDLLENLYSNIEVSGNAEEVKDEFPNQYLTDLQLSVSEKRVMEMGYYSGYKGQDTSRYIEPIGLFYYSASWHLIAWCQLRSDYRDFRVDRIKSLRYTDKRFDQHDLLTLKEYLGTIMHDNREVEKMVVLFDKEVARYLGAQKHQFGFALEEDMGEKVRMTFLVSRPYFIARWLLTYGKHVEVEQPESLNEMLRGLAEEIADHYRIGERAQV